MATLPGEPQYISGVSYYVANEEETNMLVEQLFNSQEEPVENTEDN